MQKSNNSEETKKAKELDKTKQPKSQTRMRNLRLNWIIRLKYDQHDVVKREYGGDVKNKPLLYVQLPNFPKLKDHSVLIRDNTSPEVEHNVQEKNEIRNAIEC